MRPPALAVRSPRQDHKGFKTTCADEFLGVIDSVSGTGNFRLHSPRRHLAVPHRPTWRRSGRASVDRPRRSHRWAPSPRRGGVLVSELGCFPATQLVASADSFAASSRARTRFLPLVARRESEVHVASDCRLGRTAMTVAANTPAGVVSKSARSRRSPETAEARPAAISSSRTNAGSGVVASRDAVMSAESCSWCEGSACSRSERPAFDPAR